MNIEEFKFVDDFENYGVSEAGKVLSFNYGGSGKEGFLIPQSINGYLRVDLYNENGRKHFLIHRLVAIAYIDNPLNREIVNHKDGNKENNHKNNLEWCTSSENSKHAITNKLSENYGSGVHSAKLTDVDVIAIRLELSNNEYRGQLSALAKKYGVHRSNISNIKRGHTWKHLL